MIKELFDSQEELAAALEYVGLRLGSMTKGEWVRSLIAKAAIPVIVAGGRFDLEAARDVSGQESKNNISTLLGAGCGGKGDGPNLIIGKTQEIVPCKTNVAKLLNCLGEVEQKELITEIDESDESDKTFKQLFEDLPLK